MTTTTKASRLHGNAVNSYLDECRVTVGIDTLSDVHVGPVRAEPATPSEGRMDE